ncbi:MAG: hypothetical protein ABR954_03790 [Dehalococcoidales bacterium]
MVEESRLDNLQDEIKLLKGELKNSLASVRDYLLNMELPSSEFSTILAALSGDNTRPQALATDGDISNKDDMLEPNLDEENPEEADGEIKQPDEDENLLDFGDPDKEGETSEELPNEDALDDMVAEDELLPEEETEELPEEVEEPQDEMQETEDEGLPEEELTPPEDELPLDEEQLEEYNRLLTEANQGIPKVNMLANLINWVARAKQDIGYEELPTFLEVYGISGHLSPELKDIILRLAEIAKDLPDNTKESEIWSQSMLALHGVLTGGDAPQNLVAPSWVDGNGEAESSLEDEIIEIDKAKEKSAKLKLVLPTDNGKNKEFCIDLTPEDNNDAA